MREILASSFCDPLQCAFMGFALGVATTMVAVVWAILPQLRSIGERGGR